MRGGILRKIWLGISVLLIAYAVSGIFSYVSLRMVQDSLSKYSREHTRISESSRMLLENLIQQMWCYDHAVFTGDRSHVDKAHVCCKSSLKALDLMQDVKLSSKSRGLLVSLRKDIMIHEKDASALCERLAVSGGGTDRLEKAKMLEDRSKIVLKKARLLADDIFRCHVADVDKLRISIARRKRLELTIMIVGFIISVVLMVMIIDRSIMKPLGGLMTCFAMGAGGNYSTRMRENSPGEIGLLARYFNYFMDRIDKDNKRLQHEIAERKEAEARKEELLTKLNRAEHFEAVTVLAGGAAREIGSVLRPVAELPDKIIHHLDGVANGDAESIEKLKAEILNVGKCAERASTTVDDLMSLGGLVDAAKYPEDLNLLADEFCVSDEFVAMSEGKPDVSLLKDFSSDVAKVLVSPAHVIRMLSHLCKNGFEAITSGEGSLSIRTFPSELKENLAGYEVIAEGRYTVLAVSDTGRGVPAKYLGRIFDPFFSLTDSDDKARAGMGLSLVRGIMKDHSGFVDVETEDGGGSTFYLYFPVIAEDE